MIKKVDTAIDLAEALQLSPATIRKWCRTTDIPIIRCGRAVRFDRAAVMAWLAKGGPKKRQQGNKGDGEQ